MNKLLLALAIALSLPSLAIAQQVPSINSAIQSSGGGAPPVVLTPSFPGQAVAPATPQMPAQLQAQALPQAQGGQTQSTAASQANGAAQSVDAQSQQGDAPQVLHAKKKTDPRVEKMQETFDLEQRAKVAEYLGSNMQKPTAARNRGSATVYSYNTGSIYVVYCGLDRITDVMLQPGEKLPNGNNSFVAGDTTRWSVVPMTSGDGATAQTHLIIKPLDDGASTNLMIATDKHVYMLDLRSVDDWYMPGVSWSYPEEAMQAFAAQAQATTKVAQTTATIPVTADSLDFNYKVKNHGQSWAPAQGAVFDDGTHTYLRMPTSVNSGDAPVLFVIENKQAIYVNYRVKAGDGDKGPLYVIDRLFDKAELRVGNATPVQILRHAHWFN